MADIDEFGVLCKNCRFWAELDAMPSGAEWGLCLRHAPRPLVAPYVAEKRPNTNTSVLWPETMEDQYCSEFEPKKEGQGVA